MELWYFEHQERLSNDFRQRSEDGGMTAEQIRARQIERWEYLAACAARAEELLKKRRGG